MVSNFLFPENNMGKIATVESRVIEYHLIEGFLQTKPRARPKEIAAATGLVIQSVVHYQKAKKRWDKILVILEKTPDISFNALKEKMKSAFDVFRTDIDVLLEIHPEKIGRQLVGRLRRDAHNAVVRREIALKLLARNPEVTRRELAEAMGVDRRSVARVLRNLSVPIPRKSNFKEDLEKRRERLKKKLIVLFSRRREWSVDELSQELSVKRPFLEGVLAEMYDGAYGHLVPEKVSDQFLTQARRARLVELKRENPYRGASELARFLGVTVEQIKADMSAVAAEWARARKDDYEFYVDSMLHEIRYVKQLCMLRHLGPKDKDGKYRDDYKPSPEWLRLFIQAQEREAKLLGLDAPERVDIGISSPLSKEERDRVTRAFLSSEQKDVVDLLPNLAMREDDNG